jgi:3-methyladenine DNA glycosylase/8-oxoguanine DNA glycosylase
MVLHITGQRISAAAAFTVFDRITAAGGNIPGPDMLLALGADPLRALGLSRAKAGSVSVKSNETSGCLRVLW